MNAPDPILIRTVEVAAILDRLATLAIRVPMPPEGAPDRHHIGYQEFGLSFTHALSIVSLAGHHADGVAASAFALVRPMVETLQRGWWFTSCATDEQAATFLETDRFPIRSAVDVAAAIDAHPPFVGTGFFCRFSQEEWNLYHSFTHGGVGSLAIYGNRSTIGAEFDPGMVIAAVDNAARMGAMAAMGMCWVCAKYDAATVQPIYDEVLAMGPQLGVPAAITDDPAPNA